jgi:hypothetical protein
MKNITLCTIQILTHPLSVTDMYKKDDKNKEIRKVGSIFVQPG